MGPTPYNSSNSSSSACSSSTKPPPPQPPDQMDHLLAGAGYKVRSNDLTQVAERLEHLETVMVKSSPVDISDIGNDAVYYNPTDLASWVDSLLTELNPNGSGSGSGSGSGFVSGSGPAYVSDPVMNDMNNVYGEFGQQVVTPIEEDVSIRLVHVLMTCAEAVQRGDLSLAGLLIDDLQGLLGRVNSGCGIGKVGSFFVDALSRRVVNSPQNGVVQVDLSAYENEILYHHYYEACPYLKFAHFTANQAILEAFDGQDCVHVIDFNLMQGLQWPALIQALALRPGGPPLLRLTGIGPPSLDGRDSLREIGLKLAELARSVNVRFAFRGVAATRLDDVKPWMLQVSPKEAVAVNSIMQLHKLLGPGGPRGPPVDLVLDWIRDLNPRILMVVEQESNHNQPEFLDRFTESLYYYSTMFDSLDACTAQPEKTLAELYIQREICNVVCCEGSARVERHEPLVRWRERLTGAGFAPLHLGSNAFKQARMLLTLFSAEGYSVEENEGCLTLGWHSRPLIAASAWQAIPKPSVVTTGR
ncbi:putative transcription factor GRAS family [Helianthus annuus]|uniref:DELLA protein n=1 Tax=Helianthus annuus TaxID=4232 RepID=A0A251TPQ9_HELAN|nr:DELLA protein GAI [Helianthus annuus]KAF5788383.1 putative transcription factor GRAS family [Helianthus annuus]KAJ0515427.1 putative transcription factor GRAS family [Helianthus annuus]KAJ0701803.1 putative transcription factor GRAS family [Helianthus annuus]KAJ0881582.1 putative transcription factor GRAS family [Helianthus annuus]